MAKGHDRRLRRKHDDPLGARAVLVAVVRRRFRCPWDHHVFTEPEAEVGGWRRRTTHRFRSRLGQEGSRQPVQHIAHRYGVSPTTVQRAVHDCARVRWPPAAAATPVSQVGIDDFSLRRGRRYATGFHDLTTRRGLAVVEGRTAEMVQATLEHLGLGESGLVVSMDMARAYRAAVQLVCPQLVCPQALITVDKFHVIKRIQDAVAAVWRRLVRGLGRDAPLRRDGRLVLCNREALDAAAWTRLRPVLRQYPELRRAWLLEEDFRRWYRTATPRSARLELGAWKRRVAACGLPELIVVGGMFREWREEILTYFTTRATQGPVEGRNRCAKLLQRQGYGYRNLANSTVRLQLTSGPSP